MTTPTARLEVLEAEAFRAQHYQAQVAARLDHITNALGDLSQDGRAITLDVREIKAGLMGTRTELAGVKTELTQVKTDLAGVKTDVAQVKTDVAEVKTDVAEVKSEVRQGFASIMARLDTIGGNG
jgi:chromosome segregation ATPase